MGRRSAWKSRQDEALTAVSIRSPRRETPICNAKGTAGAGRRDSIGETNFPEAAY